MSALLVFLRALPIWQQLVSGAIALLVIGSVLGGLYLAWHHKVYREGYDAAIAAIAAQDQEAIDARDKALSRITECRAAGGVWRQATGLCERR